MDAGWRRLALFWAAIGVVTAGGAAALQVMGPPGRPAGPAPVALLTSSPSPMPPTSPPPPSPPPGPLATAPAIPGVIRSPDMALQEPAPDFPGRYLPRRAADGRAAMSYYAHAGEPADKRPKVALLMVGLGQAEGDTRAASATLPPAVSLGFSPYSPNPDPLLADARDHGHEYLITLPMESQGYPLNDSGPHALLSGAEEAMNAKNLEWTLSRMQGEVGLTGASDGLRGERFANAAALFGPVLEQFAARGLIYVDPRPGAPAKPGVAVVTIIVDDPPDRGSIDGKLATLEQQALDGQPALGLAGLLRPVTVERIAAWARGLENRGVALVPVSAMVQPPP